MKNSNTFKVLGLAAVLFFCGQSIKAQTALETSIFFNGVAPSAEFNDNATLTSEGLFGKDQIGTAAALGFGGGIRASLPFDIGVGYVAPFVGADLFWNRPKSSLRTPMMEADDKVPQYFNIPIMVGVQYRYPLADMGLEYVTPYAEFGVGYDFFMIGAEGAKNKYYYNYKVKGAMAWQLGVGTFLANHVSIGIHYYGLGTHQIKYGNGCVPDMASSTNLNQLRRIGEWALRFGFHF